MTLLPMTPRDRPREVKRMRFRTKEAWYRFQVCHMGRSMLSSSVKKVGVESRRAFRRRTVKVLAFHWASQAAPAWRISVPDPESMAHGKPAVSAGTRRGCVIRWVFR